MFFASITFTYIRELKPICYFILKKFSNTNWINKDQKSILYVLKQCLDHSEAFICFHCLILQITIAMLT